MDARVQLLDDLEWHEWLCEFEKLFGRVVADGPSIDWLYDRYMGDEAPADAIERLQGLRPAAHTVNRLVARLGEQVAAGPALHEPPGPRQRVASMLLEGVALGAFLLLVLVLMALWVRS